MGGAGGVLGRDPEEPDWTAHGGPCLEGGVTFFLKYTVMYREVVKNAEDGSGSYLSHSVAGVKGTRDGQKTKQVQPTTELCKKNEHE